MPACDLRHQVGGGLGVDALAAASEVGLLQVAFDSAPEPEWLSAMLLDYLHGIDDIAQ